MKQVSKTKSVKRTCKGRWIWLNVDSCERSLLKGEALRFSARPPSCESPLKFPAFVQMLAIRTLISNAGMKTCNWQIETIILLLTKHLPVRHSLQNFQRRGEFKASFPIEKLKMTIKKVHCTVLNLFIAPSPTPVQCTVYVVNKRSQTELCALLAIRIQLPTAVRGGLSRDGWDWQCCIRFTLQSRGSGPNYGGIFVAGCVGGAVQLSIACPVELIKGKNHSQNLCFKRDHWKVISLI